MIKRKTIDLLIGVDEEEIIPFRKITDIYREEKRKKNLTPIPFDFYERVEESIGEGIRKNQEVLQDDFSLAQMGVEDTILKMCDKVQEIWKMRWGKILKCFYDENEGKIINHILNTHIKAGNKNLTIKELKQLKKIQHIINNGLIEFEAPFSEIEKILHNRTKIFFNNKRKIHANDVWKKIPLKPGIYFGYNINKGGDLFLFYIGQSKKLKNRCYNHPKRLLYFDYAIIEDEEKRLVKEKRLIKRYNPPKNIEYNDNGDINND